MEAVKAMTVKELRKVLDEYDLDDEVYLMQEEYGLGVVPVTNVLSRKKVTAGVAGNRIILC